MKTAAWILSGAIALIAVSVSVSAQDRTGSPKQIRGAGGLTVSSLDTGVTATDLANAIAGSGVTVSNVTYTGAQTGAGTFGNGGGSIGLASGIVLGSGNVNDVIGPNTLDDVTTVQGTAGDADLDSASGFNTFDAAVLEFDIVPSSGTVFIQYVFASDEYNEFVGSTFNDVFAFFINGTNCATVGGDPVSINTINNGNPFGSGGSNPGLYRNNDLNDGGGSIDTEMDGLTTVLTCQASVNAGVVNTVKLAIADASDELLDSAVFIQANGVTTVPPTIETRPVPAVDRFGAALLMLLILALGGFAVYRRIG